MIRAFAELFQDLLIQLSEEEKWIGNKSVKNVMFIGRLILNNEILPEEIIQQGIDAIQNENPDSNDELIILLLAILNSEIEESIPESLKCFERLAQMFDATTQKQIASFLAAIRIMELKDFNNFLADGLKILDHYKEDPLSAVWRLSNEVNVKEHIDTFLVFIEKAKETAGPRVNLFEGWFFFEVGDYSKSLECYLLVKDQLGNELMADELADLWNSIAICYMSLPNPNPSNALTAINKALQFDYQLDEFQNEITYLATRAQIYLMLDDKNNQNKEKAIADLNRVITYDSDHEVALDLLRKIYREQFN
jgi:tetratricopeptide (TPR) repeat protein